MQEDLGQVISEAIEEKAAEIASAEIAVAEHMIAVAVDDARAAHDRAEDIIQEVKQNSLEEKFELWQRTHQETVSSLTAVMQAQSQMLAEQGATLRSLLAIFEEEDEPMLPPTPAPQYSSTPPNSEAADPSALNPNEKSEEESQGKASPPKTKGPRLI
jgi:hypothetical protein